MNVLVTGATGFVGSALVRLLLDQGKQVVAGVRMVSSKLPAGVRQVPVGDMLAYADWSDALNSVDAVVHAAARVHVRRDQVSEPLAEFRKVNVDGTLQLARQAAGAGVKRFVFISSIKVNGQVTEHEQYFFPDDVPNPVDPYGISKYEAEQGLLQIAKKTGMEAVIIRPPLVYGPGVKANFLSIMQLVHKGIPLPLDAVPNKRSLLALDNLVDFIARCLDHPGAANEVFLISDGEDVSTTELLRRIAVTFGKRALLFPVPLGLMKFAAGLLGKREVVDRLFGSLRVDSSKAFDLLGWNPVVTMDKALQKTVNAYIERGVNQIT